MPAYAESYLMDAMENLGEMADCAAAAPNVSLAEFWHVFVSSTVAREIAKGSPFTIVGKSGLELANEVCEQGGLAFPDDPNTLSVSDSFNLSPSYWCGWILAFYQWSTSLTFAEINRHLPISTVFNMYRTYHEQSEDRFREAADEIIAASSYPQGLKRQRTLMGLSQSQLAQRSGVGIRAIQQYEQGSKDISRASFDNVRKLAKALHCQPQDLMPPARRFEYGVVAL
ncbi:helix-turn-helix domain-containing protein [Adlercreutzia sp. ZJ138]|uniref:helix-turn-helix domain-containing protein n=1 Tax=Adlercreutzia sp. ZJ138 TaxID=2709405 RepID=UPI0013EA7641|nr:helix-turn-helix transcriptional regulator [Adlercreutzia sp. ZJ138]